MGHLRWVLNESKICMKRMRKRILALEKSIISRRKAYSQGIKEKMNMMLAREKMKQKYILAFTTCLFCALDIDEDEERTLVHRSGNSRVLPENTSCPQISL